MAILAQTIVDRCNSFLDSEGSDRYSFDRDYIFAINSSIEWITTLINKVYSINKFPAEYLRELTKVSVFITSNTSRFDPSLLSDDLWSVLSIYPKITYSGTLEAQPDLSVSVLCPSAYYTNSEKSCKRLTIEQWNDKDNNIFSSGSRYFDANDDYIEYSYLDFMTYKTNPEIEIAPDVSNEAIAVSYLKIPTPISVIGDSLEFPTTLTDLFVKKTLNNIAIKQNDDVLKRITDADINSILNSLV